MNRSVQPQAESAEQQEKTKTSSLGNISTSGGAEKEEIEKRGRELEPGEGRDQGRGVS